MSIDYYKDIFTYNVEDVTPYVGKEILCIFDYESSGFGSTVIFKESEYYKIESMYKTHGTWYIYLLSINDLDKKYREKLGFGFDSLTAHFTLITKKELRQKKIKSILKLNKE